jgi:F-type H+-transporting ATPase subunit delta
MTNRAAATRYARALFDVLQQQAPAASSIERAQSDLQGFADLLTTVPQLAATFGNPAIPVAKKRAIVQALLQKGGISGPLAKVVLLLAERDRLMLLPDLATAYRERVLDWKNVIRGEVTTAAPIPAEKLHALEERLTQATGRTVTLDAKVDPSIVGGAVTRLGSVVYDGSVTTQLRRLKESLIEAAQ